MKNQPYVSAFLTVVNNISAHHRLSAYATINVDFGRECYSKSRAVAFEIMLFYQVESYFRSFEQLFFHAGESSELSGRTQSCTSLR